MHLKKYPEYKNSSLRWLGKIPSHWIENRAKCFLSEIDERSSTGTEEMLSVSHIRGVTPRKLLNVSMFKAESNKGHKLCKPGDLVINTMWAWMAAMGVARSTGVVSPAYGVYRLKKINSYHPYFLDQLLRIEEYRSEYICRSTGIRSSRLRLYPDKFLDIRIICPPYEEQIQIVRFLQYFESLNKTLLREKKQAIKLLKEQKQVILYQAVTRGLNANVELKPSGMSWLDDIPAHWLGLAIRRCSKVVKTGGTPAGANEKYYSSSGFNWFTPGDFTDELYLSSSARQLSELGKEHVNIFPPNTVMMIGIGTIGKVAISKGFASCNQQINAIVPNPMVDSEFLALSLRAIHQYIISCGKCTTMPILNQDETKSIKIPLPPLVEQRTIVDMVNSRTININRAISSYEREIELIQEYRSRLICDAVTGKIDVRNAQIEDFTFDEVTDNFIETEEGEESLELMGIGNEAD